MESYLHIQLGAGLDGDGAQLQGKGPRKEALAEQRP